MIPNMYKIAGELTPCCLHVAARSIATHALSIFGDHSDVMACRQTGWAMLCADSVQEAQDFAAIGQVASLGSRVPILHFFDGFRTSHELACIDGLPDEALEQLVDREAIAAHRSRGLTPDRPELRGTAQNPDAFFQAREASNPFHVATADVVQDTMDRFAQITGRQYHLFEYEGHPEAERVIVIMGSGAETTSTTVERLVAKGEKVGVLRCRLYRPFDVDRFVAALPATTRSIAVLDRTKEPGSVGEPLYLDVVAALREGGREGLADAQVIGGRYGLSSKEFTPAMVKAVFDELVADEPKRHFTVGIHDDVSHSSLTVDPNLDFEPEGATCALFYGLGSDGTVSANKSSIKILSQGAGRESQAYFVYDSKKAGAVTVSHLRFSDTPIRAPWQVQSASFVACHQFNFLDRIDVLERAAPGATFLLNCPHPVEEVWDLLPREVQEAIVEKGLAVHVVDAHGIARSVGLGGRINTVMQTCFFALSGVLPDGEAIPAIKAEIERVHGKRGREIVDRNFAAVDSAVAGLHELAVPASVTSTRDRPPVIPDEAPDFTQAVTAMLLAGKGDQLPVSAFPIDGTWPTATAKWEKRNLAGELPDWDEKLCIQCNKCALICPHAAIRAKIVNDEDLAAAPEGFRAVPLRGSKEEGKNYVLQVAPEDCTGCSLCIEVCPAKDKANPRHRALDPIAHGDVVDREREAYSFFLDLPEIDRSQVKMDNKGSQFLQPLFEYSGACAGCGETPYLKLLTQLFGDRALIANATGCSSIYGGNLPTTPWTVDDSGRGPAWSNSLFEDNAEFGFGFRLAVDQLEERAKHLLRELAASVGDELATALLQADQSSEAGLAEQRERIVELKRVLAGQDGAAARELEQLADSLAKKSVWLVGGDGWAYDIGYGGLDHVLSQQRNVNVLVLDTEVYSNTGGQQSKATPLGATAKFAAAGKEVPKKDLGMEAMSYGHVYVARVAMGARDQQTVKAFTEAESWPGPSLIIAYSHCIAHGYDLRFGAQQQLKAVQSGSWPLYRFDPRRIAEGKAPLVLDSPEPKLRIEEYMKGEERFRAVKRRDPKRFRRLIDAAQRSAAQRFDVYRQLAGLEVQPDEAPETEPSDAT
jgi:pyruvate-ferredoxin/flavodoxin oxidoreductase